MPVNQKKVVGKTTKKTSTKKTNGRGRPTKFREGMGAQWFAYYEETGSMIKASHKMNLHHETILEWAKIHQEISDAVKKAKEIDKGKMQEYGLNGMYNPSMAMFLLKCNHGFIERDKKETIDLKREELDHRLKGELDSEQQININFSEVTKDDND